MVADKQSTMIRTVGRRKTATARVRIQKGKGNVVVNDKELKEYFPLILWQEKVLSPFVVSGKEGQFDVSIRVLGGGVNSQAEAIRHGIARALVELDETFKPALKAEGYLTRDSRRKERKKPGRRRARRGHQWRKR
ncbi:MAG: 30S ribosomal protein S9 [Candidatus Magasanikbacteria bacterium]|nr:30S ribosomal protein S9 [Candidatus Magasanikbacteria bacterium]